jgi:hypothetical protein
MNQMREANRALVEHMVNPWAKGINPNQDNNLPAAIVQTPYPKVGPGQRIAGVTTPIPGTGGPELKIVPMPLAPSAPVAEAMTPGHFIIKENDATVITTVPVPAPGPGVAAGPAETVKEIKPIKVTANYDLKNNFANMNGEPIGSEKGIPPAQRIDPALTKDRVVYVKVELQRAEVNPDQVEGTSEASWETLPQSDTEKLPVLTWGDSAKATLDAIHPLRGVILEPRFYQSTTAAVSGPAAPTGPEPVLPLIPTSPGAGGGRQPPPAGTVLPTTPTPAAGGGRLPPPAGTVLPTTPAAGGAAGATPAPGDAPVGPVLSVVPPPAVLDEATTATVPIVAYDQSAKPGRQYKYRMRVTIANPAYHADEKLEKAQLNLNDEPTLTSDWSPESPVFVVEPDQTFYVAAVRQWAANFRIWQLINAKWEHTEGEVVVGDTVGAQKDPQFATDYMVVDATPSRVILMNIKDGKLEVRDVSMDEKAAEKRLQKDKDLETLEAVPKVP